MAKLSAVSLAFLTILAPMAMAQPAMPTNNVLSRLLMVESQYGRGTIFSIDVDNREYWITAKHILTGALHPPYGAISIRSVSLNLLNPGAEGEQWIPVRFSVLDPGKDIDIVVLAAAEAVMPDPLPSVPADSAGAFLGGDCEFLGFPYGGGWRSKRDDGKWFWMPYVKHCTVSAFASEETKVWVLDGINNEGFSGGPVVFRTGPDQKIMAVISGYVLEPADVISSGLAKSSQSPQSDNPATHRSEKVNLNSGFILAYDIRYAVEAIRKDPIGPLRKAK